jgi:hypothetical protein
MADASKWRPYERSTPVSWVKGTLFANKPAVQPTGQTGAKKAAAPTSDATKSQFSDMESGHTALEGSTTPAADTLATSGINWPLIVAIAGVVLTLFWILRKT